MTVARLPLGVHDRAFEARSYHGSAARESLHQLGLQLEKTYPKDNAGRNNDMLPMNQTFIPPQQRALFAKAGGLMMVVVGLVLLIACANVANLLLTA